MFDIKKVAEEVAKAIPKITPSKNGYEIRSELVNLAQNHLWQDYQARLGQYEFAVKNVNGSAVTTLTMPEVPGTDQIIATAQKFYDFVNLKNH